jgi:AcrR family transcriptional regulator
MKTTTKASAKTVGRRRNGAKRADKRDPESLAFAERLSAAAEAPAKRKGERTRALLKAAAAQLLERGGYRALRVTDINEKAGVSNALFYVYFPNKEKITEEVMTEFLDVLFSHSARDTAPNTVEESIYRANLDYVRRFAANPGLMRCLLQFGDEIAEFEKLWRERNGRWVERSVKRLSHEPDLTVKSVAEIWTATAALGMMMDGILRLIYVEREPKTRDHARSIAPDEPRLALFLTRLWVRAMFAREMVWSPEESK